MSASVLLTSALLTSVLFTSVLLTSVLLTSVLLTSVLLFLFCWRKKYWILHITPPYLYSRFVLRSLQSNYLCSYSSWRQDVSPTRARLLRSLILQGHIFPNNFSSRHHLELGICSLCSRCASFQQHIPSYSSPPCSYQSPQHCQDDSKKSYLLNWSMQF